MRIEVLIDELVLHGFDPRERLAIGDGLTTELGRLLASDAPSWRGARPAEVAHVAGPRITIAPAQPPGPALAGAVRSAIATTMAAKP